MKIKDQISDWVVSKITDPETKEKVVDKWNKNLNIPIIGEATEEKILSAIYDSVEEVIKKAILK